MYTTCSSLLEHGVTANKHRQTLEAIAPRACSMIGSNFMNLDDQDDLVDLFSSDDQGDLIFYLWI